MFILFNVDTPGIEPSIISPHVPRPSRSHTQSFQGAHKHIFNSNLFLLIFQVWVHFGMSLLLLSHSRILWVSEQCHVLRHVECVGVCVCVMSNFLPVKCSQVFVFIMAVVLVLKPQQLVSGILTRSAKLSFCLEMTQHTGHSEILLVTMSRKRFFCFLLRLCHSTVKFN